MSPRTWMVLAASLLVAPFFCGLARADGKGCPGHVRIGRAARRRGHRPGRPELGRHAGEFLKHLQAVREMGSVEHPRAPEHEDIEKSGKLCVMEGGRGLGVTAGGMQDIGLARRLIREGLVPHPDAFSVEAMLSEHDIPVEPAGVQEAIFPSISVGWTRRYGSEEPEAVLAIGFGSSLDEQAIVRRPLNIAAVVDMSGSMTGGPVNSAREALKKLVDKLDVQDRLSIVLFNDVVTVPFPSTVMTEDARDEALRVVREIDARGFTNLEKGVRFGLEQIAAHFNGEQSARLVVFTDAMPNVGATSPFDFLPMIQGAAQMDIGLTVFGVSLWFDNSLAYEISRCRGANYYYIDDAETLARAFEDDFEYLVAPVAHDVEVEVRAVGGFGIKDAVGFQKGEKGDGSLKLTVGSLFLSSREGGAVCLVALAPGEELPEDGGEMAELSISYYLPFCDESVDQDFYVGLPADLARDGIRPYYSNDGVRRAFLLAEACRALRSACAGEPDAAKGFRSWASSDVWKNWRKHPLDEAEDKVIRKAGGGLKRFMGWFRRRASALGGLSGDLSLMNRLARTLSTYATPAVGPCSVTLRGRARMLTEDEIQLYNLLTNEERAHGVEDTESSIIIF